MTRFFLILVGLLSLGCAAFEEASKGHTGESAFEPEDTATERCTPYCQRMMANCTLLTTFVYPEGDDCYAACAEFPLTGVVGDEVGDTLQCRETYVDQTSDEHETYCPLAGPDSEACI